jgi:hypothetical protein
MNEKAQWCLMNAKSIKKHCKIQKNPKHLTTKQTNPCSAAERERIGVRILRIMKSTSNSAIREQAAFQVEVRT